MLLRVIAAAVCAVAGFATVSEAQTLREIGGPRETPPASYTANQYVDSRGCVFLRAGYGGQVNWVPRVSRDRKVLCGYQPTFAARPAAPQTTTTAQVGNPIDTNASTNTPPTIQMKPATQPRIDPARHVAPPVVNLPATKPVVQAAAKPEPKTRKIPVVTGRSDCPGVTETSRRYMLSDGRHAVRCGPQAGYPFGTYLVVEAPRTGGSGGLRAYAELQPGDGMPPLPKGYKRAWKDDRLNPGRGMGTAAGQAAMDQIWTPETPRRLVDATVVRKVAQPQVHQQVKQVTMVRAGGTTVSTKDSAVQMAALEKPRVSTKTAPKAKLQATQAPAMRAFVQVGSFEVRSNAAGVIARLKELGLPVATQTIKSGGKTMQIVFAGPFPSGNDASAALSAARRIGFNDAFIRR